MESLNAIIIEFEKILIEKKSPILNILQEGLPVGGIQKLLNQVDLNNEELINLYRWKNGVSNMSNRVIGEMELFSRGIMLSLQDAIEHYQYALSENLWSGELFPIFTNGGGDYLLLNTVESAGNVLIYSPSILLSDKPIVIYESLKLLFETVINCYKLHAYKYKEDGSLEIDYDLEQDISKKKNPNTEYWEQ
jgi:hypothetical protein